MRRFKCSELVAQYQAALGVGREPLWWSIALEQVAYLQKWFRIVPKRFWRQQDRVVKIGIAFTVCFFAFVLLFGFAPSCESLADCKNPKTKWSVFWNAPPNVVGDTLAGVAGVLAFLWIIVTVLLQSKELAAQRQELKQARKEYAKMADAQDEQVQQMSVQAKIFKDEQRQRDEARADRVLEQYITSACKWAFKNKANGKWMTAHEAIHFEVERRGAWSKVLADLDSYFDDVANDLKKVAEHPNPDEPFAFLYSEACPENLEVAQAIVEKIEVIKGRVSEESSEWLINIGYESFSAGIQRLLDEEGSNNSKIGDGGMQSPDGSPVGPSKGRFKRKNGEPQ